MINIKDDEFSKLSELVYNRFGIHLTDRKRGLVVGRLQKLLHTLNFKSFNEYYEYLISDKSHQALIELVNRISTNYSYFFREQDHFDYFIKHVIPELKKILLARKVNDIRLWSAGCSTGEEPYTIIMLLKEFFGIEYASWDLGILATDISDRVIQIARQGNYPDDRLQRVPQALRKKYFTQSGQDQFRVKDEIKKEVTFRRFNLMNPTFPFKKKFHVIFCRNVMIYFDQQTRENLIRKFYDNLVKGGYLFIGHSETLGRDNSYFEYVMPAAYKKI